MRHRLNTLRIEYNSLNDRTAKRGETMGVSALPSTLKVIYHIIEHDFSDKNHNSLPKAIADAAERTCTLRRLCLTDEAEGFALLKKCFEYQQDYQKDLNSKAVAAQNTRAEEEKRKIRVKAEAEKKKREEQERLESA